MSAESHRCSAASRGRAAFPLLLVNDVVWWRLRPRLRVASDV